MLGVCLTLIDEPSDKEKFAEMYDTYYIFMIKTAMSVLNNKALAEETVQDCLLKLAEIIRDVPEIPSKRAKAMIMTVVRNKSINNLKAEHYDKEEPFAENEIPDNIINIITSELGYKSLVEMVNGLEAVYKDVLVLRLVYGYSVAEIAEMLDLPYRTVETRIYRGRKMLKEKLEGDLQ